ncbi:MAG: GWxTD domain-containing protein, partial [bacterium]
MKKNLAGFSWVALALPLFLPPRFQEQDKIPITAEAYLQLLPTSDTATLRNEYEAEFVLLLDGKEKQYYEALALPERPEYIARYWRLRDPDPFTPNNERLEEHLRRRYYAREQFSMDRPPYFDDRGKIYLKYGRPRDRYVDPGVYMQVNRELSIFLPDAELFGEAIQSASSDTGILARGLQGRPLRGRESPGTLLPPGQVMVLENETWSYEHLQPGLVFNFVRQGKYFRLTADLMKAVTGGRFRYRILQTAVLYLRRQNVSRAYVDLARNLEDVGQRMRTQPGGLQLNQLNHEIRVALERNIFEAEEAIRKSPPEAFVHKTETSELPFSADIAQFRGDQDRTRLAIGVAVNLGLSQFAMDSTGNPVTGVSYGYVLSDRNGQRMAGGEQKKEVPATASGKASVLGSVSLMELNCTPDQYVMAVQAVEVNGARKGMVKLPLLVRDFRGAALMLSDIQFCVPVSGAAYDGAESLEPKTLLYPFNTVLKSIPLTVYFEIYNLSKIGLNNEYRIDYNVSEASTGKNFLRTITKPFSKNDDVSITLSEMRSVTQPTSRESLTLDFGKLRPGAYQLQVTVSAVQESNVVASVAK